MQLALPEARAVLAGPLGFPGGLLLSSSPGAHVDPQLTERLHISWAQTFPRRSCRPKVSSVSISLCAVLSLRGDRTPLPLPASGALLYILPSRCRNLWRL